MTINKPLAATVLAAFLGLHVYAVATVGLMSFFELVRQMSGWQIVLTADLCISLFLVGTWLYRDAKAKGVSAAPYLALTVGLGSVGPLLYMLRRKS